MVRRGHHRLHRLRRTRQRNDGGPPRVSGTGGSAHGAVADGTDDSDREHVQHACRGARSVDLHGNHAGGVLPRHGLPRGHHGGFDVPLGGGPARAVRPIGGNACGRRISGVSSRASGQFLRTGRLCAQPERDERFRDGHRGRLASRRRLLRTRDAAHVAFHPLLLGAGPRPRERPPLSRHQLA